MLQLKGYQQKALDSLRHYLRKCVELRDADAAFYETTREICPSAIIEFTATPDSERNPSNVLHSVSVAELKAESMIKLPIRLETKTDWQSLLSDAVLQRADLEKKPESQRRATGDYVRPIMLIQAQSRHHGRETLTVEIVERVLIEDHQIPRDQIARATGEDKELAGVDLRDEKCPIRFVITVQALREGWDCPYAYVLCSLAEQRSKGAVEQILGRVLRLPYCRPREINELNFAYAFVASSNFAKAAQNLVDALVENGFNRQEAQDFIKPGFQDLPLFQLPPGEYKALTKTITLPEVPEVTQLSPAIRDKVEIDPERKTITVDPRVCTGKPCIRGTRIYISIILDALAEGLTPEEIIDHYPSLRIDDIRAAVACAAELAR